MILTERHYKFLKEYGILYDFIKRFKEEVDWYEISKFIDEKNVEEFIEFIDWDSLTAFNILSEEFMTKYYDNLNIHNICECQKLSENFLRNFVDRKEFWWDTIVINQKLSEDFLSDYIYEFDSKDILVYQDISREFVEKHEEHFDWYELSKGETLLPPKVYAKFFDKFYWEIVSGSAYRGWQGLSEGFLIQFQNYIHWDIALKKQRITIELMKMLEDKIGKILMHVNGEYGKYIILEPVFQRKDGIQNKNLLIQIEDSPFDGKTIISRGGGWFELDNITTKEIEKRIKRGESMTKFYETQKKIKEYEREIN